MEPDAAEIRVLGCLIEKQRTTPDVYPLTINALRAACNQTTSRDPAVEYDEATVRAALDRLSARGWTRLASWSNTRTPKYRHLAGEALGLSSGEQALMAVLMLRGAQTPAELRQRAERMQSFTDDEVAAMLDALAARALVAVDRRPGQRGARWHQLLAGGDEAPVPAVPEEDRLARIEAELERLRDEVRALRAERQSSIT